MLIFFADKIFFLLNLTLFKRLQLESSYDGGRLKIWEATLNALTSDIRHIIFGVSEGGLPFISGSNWPLVDSDNPHNILLYFWAATGITGLTLLISLVLLCGYAIYKKKNLHQIVFYLFFVNSLVFAGFGFYENYSKTDFLNIGIVVAFAIIFRKQDAKVRDTASALNPDSSRLNERYS
jgi:O-antigen ligase